MKIGRGRSNRKLEGRCRLAAIGAVLIGAAGCVGASINNSIPANAPPGAPEAHLPALTLADLEGREYRLPRDLDGRPALLLLGFSHGDRQVLARWLAALLPFAERHPSLKIFKVAVIESSNAALRGIIRNGMRSGTPQGAPRRQFLTLFTEKDAFARAIGLDSSRPAAVLITGSGEVSFRSIDPSDGAELSALEERIALLENMERNNVER